MKRNEILGEQKKGVKAVKYNKKPKDHSAEYGKAKEKLAPVKPMEGYNPNSVGAEHRRKLDQSHAADLKARAEAPDATERDQQRYQNYLDKKEQMANDYNDRMEREGVEQEALYRRRGSSSAYDRDYQSSVSGMGKRQSQAYQDDGGANDERHDLDPSEWYIVKDGKMYKVTVYPNQEQEARARGYSPSREQARTRADADTRSTDEAMGADMGKITKVDPATKKATLTKPDGTSMEVDSTALKPTPDGKMSMDTPDTDELKTGTAVVSTESMDAPPPTDSTSPIHGGQDHEDIRRLRELSGQPAATEISPEDEKALEPYKNVDPSDGSTYYDLPPTDPKEKGARMGTVIKSPAAIAMAKQQQPKIIADLLAMADVTLPQATMTSTPVDMPELEESDLTAMLRIAGLR